MKRQIKPSIKNEQFFIEGQVKNKTEVTITEVQFLPFVYFIWLYAITSLIIKRNKKAIITEEKSTYLLSISNIMEDYLQKKDINISSVIFTDELTIHDLEQICCKSIYPWKDNLFLKKKIRKAVSHAFSCKYATPRKDDEKLMQISGTENWQIQFKQLLDELGLNNLNKLKVVNVGIGHAKESEGLFYGVEKLTGVDISQRALNHAKLVFSEMDQYLTDAGNLETIQNKSIDFYISLRTFQSTLFDIKAALHEAFRILKSGGIILISIPKLYVSENGELMSGLRKRYSNEIIKSRLTKNIEKIVDCLRMFDFKDIKISDNSIFETYITAIRK